MAEEPETKEDWDAIRDAAVRALTEDLAVAQQMALIGLGADTMKTIKRRIQLAEKMVFMTFDEDGKLVVPKAPADA